MATRTLNLYCRTRTQQFVSGYRETIHQALDTLSRGDILRLRVHLLEDNPAAGVGSYSPYAYRRLADGEVLRVGIGQLNRRPVEGVFKAFVVDASPEQSVDSLAVNVTAEALETALNSLTDVTEAGGLTVTGGPYAYTIRWNEAGEVPQLSFDVTGLVPNSIAIVSKRKAGAEGVQEVIGLNIVQSTAALCQEFTESVGPKVTFTTNDDQTEISIDIHLSDVASGAFSVNLLAEDDDEDPITTKKLGPVPYTISAEDLAVAANAAWGTILNNNYVWGCTVTDTGLRLYVVSKTGNSEVFTLGATMDRRLLTWRPVYEGTLDLGSDGMEDLVGDNETVTAILEAAIDDTTLAYGNITIRADLLRSQTTVPTPQHDYRGLTPFLKLAYADDAAGNGYTLAGEFSGEIDKAYQAWRVFYGHEDPEVTVEDFAGRWNRVRGLAGQSVYGYIAFANDVNGTGFVLAEEGEPVPSGKKAFAILLLDEEPTTPLTATDFDGRWQNFQGPTGPEKYPIIAFASSEAGTDWTTSPSMGKFKAYMAIHWAATPDYIPTGSDFDGKWIYKGPNGFDGWSPKFAVVSRGSDRVLQVVDWQGGSGSKPAAAYVGATGFTTEIMDAVNIRGTDGYRGWCPVFSAYEGEDGGLYLQLTDWSGGEGDKPNTGVGSFVGPEGLVIDEEDATDFRGSTGQKGWFPVLAVVDDEPRNRRVHKIVGWIGGEGDAPTELVGYYLTNDEPTSDISEAATLSENQVQADWNETDPESPSYIQNKPDLESVGAQADWNETDPESPAYIQNKPDLGFPTTAEIIGKHTLFLPASSLRPRASNGCASIDRIAGAAGQPDVEHLAFDPAAQEHAGCVVCMPKSWDKGNVTVRIHFLRADGSGGNVVWGVRAVSVGNNETTAVDFGAAVESTTAVNDGPKNTVTADMALTISGAGAPSEVQFIEVYRKAADANDTLTVDALLVGVELLYNTDAINDN